MGFEPRLSIKIDQLEGANGTSSLQNIKETNNSTSIGRLMDVELFAISCSPGIELKDDLATYSHRHSGPVFPSFRETAVDTSPH